MFLLHAVVGREVLKCVNGNGESKEIHKIFHIPNPRWN